MDQSLTVIHSRWIVIFESVWGGSFPRPYQVPHAFENRCSIRLQSRQTVRPYQVPDRSPR